MNHHPTSRCRRAIITASIAGLLLAAACGEGSGSNVQTDGAPAVPEVDRRAFNVEELNAREDYYRAGAADHLTPAAGDHLSPAAADHLAENRQLDQSGQSDTMTRPASGPRPY
jgi:hypothetical protein